MVAVLDKFIFKPAGRWYKHRRTHFHIKAGTTVNEEDYDYDAEEGGDVRSLRVCAECCELLQDTDPGFTNASGEIECSKHHTLEYDYEQEHKQVRNRSGRMGSIPSRGSRWG